MFNYQELFNDIKTIAVVGMSIYPHKAAHSVPLFMKKSGYDVIPINPNHSEVGKLKSYPNLKDVEQDIDMVNVFRPSEFALDIIKECIERKNEKGDVKIIWLQEGIVSEEGKKLAEENNIIFIEDTCIYKIYVNLDN